MAPQVLVLGMPRTGTQSIGQALGVLGFQNAYHMTTVGPNNHHDKWVAALEAKFEQKHKEFGKQEFDELFEGFNVVSDIPCSIFYKELMAAYPDAHVILTTRDEDAWVESISKTLHLAYTLAKAQPSKLASLYNMHLWGDDFLANGRQAFRKHNDGVLKAAAEQGRQVLVFDPSHGWKSLCGFLQKPVPAVDYPRKDMWVGYKNMVKEVEAGRLTEDAITIKRSIGSKAEGVKSAYIYTQQKEQEGIKSAYIYTQQKEQEGIKSAYIYTQQKEQEGIKSAYIYTQQKEQEGIKSAYIYTQQKEQEGIKSAYIYTQQKEQEGIKSAYIYTQQKEQEGIKSAYIYTQQKEQENEILKSNGQGIKSAYIYTQQREQEGIKSAYIYTQQKEQEGIKSAYIYTQQKEQENEILKSNGQGIKSAYIYTQQREQEGIKSAYIYTQQREQEQDLFLKPHREGIKAAYIYTQ